MTVTAKKTGEVLAAARKDLQAQLVVVREEMSRLAAEELALTHAVSSLDGGNPATSADGTVSKRAVGSRRTKSQGPKRSTPKATTSGRRRRRGTSKSTAERVSELQGLLAEGPKSKAAIAAALKVSPARVQQLLAELGGSVSSQRDPGQRQGKLWTLKAGSGNGASAAKPTARRSTRGAKGVLTRKPSARRKPAAK